MKDVLKKWQVLFALALLALPWPASAGSSARGQHYEATLVTQTQSAKPGSLLRIALIIRPDPNWHIYWKNPGETGYAPTLNWTLPSAWSGQQVRHPAPHLLTLAGFASNVHNGETILLQDISVAKSAGKGSSSRLKLDLDLLVCSDSSCVPDPLQLELDVPVGAGLAAPGAQAVFRRAEAALPKLMPVPAAFEADQDTLTISFPGAAMATGESARVFSEIPDIIVDAAPQKFETSDNIAVATLTKGGAAIQPGMRFVLRIESAKGTVRALEYAAEDSPAGFDVSGFLLAFGAALVGGFLLNLMPCVFPMISLKALTLARAGGNERQVKIDALGYTAGAIFTVMALGGAILLLRTGGSAVGWAFHLQDPRVMGALLLLVVAIATNMAGLFELPSLHLQGQPNDRSFLGSLSTGALSAIIATPCTGPFMAGALGAALVLPIPAAMAIFMGLGLGLASPFLALGFIKSCRTWIPKPGQWMVSMRHALSLPMFATALGLLWIIGRQSGVTGMIAALACAMLLSLGLWWYGLRQRAGKSGRRSIFPMVGALAGILLIAPLQAEENAAAAGKAHALSYMEDFDPQRLAALRQKGTPVLLYFTADWCLTCKVNEATTLNDGNVLEQLKNAKFVVMKGDWTRQDARISDFLKSQSRAGVPLYMWFDKSGQSHDLPQILSPSIINKMVKSI